MYSSPSESKASGQDIFLNDGPEKAGMSPQGWGNITLNQSKITPAGFTVHPEL